MALVATLAWYFSHLLEIHAEISDIWSPSVEAKGQPEPSVRPRLVRVKRPNIVCFRSVHSDLTSTNEKKKS